MKAILVFERVRGAIVQLLVVGAIPAALGIAIAARPATGRDGLRQGHTSDLSTIAEVEDQGRAGIMDDPDHQRNCSVCLTLSTGRRHETGLYARATTNRDSGPLAGSSRK